MIFHGKKDSPSFAFDACREGNFKNFDTFIEQSALKGIPVSKTIQSQCLQEAFSHNQYEMATYLLDYFSSGTLEGEAIQMAINVNSYKFLMAALESHPGKITNPVYAAYIVTHQANLDLSFERLHDLIGEDSAFKAVSLENDITAAVKTGASL